MFRTAPSGKQPDAAPGASSAGPLRTRAEKALATAPAPPAQPPVPVAAAQPKTPPKEIAGQAAEVADRGSMQDQQQAIFD